MSGEIVRKLEGPPSGVPAEPARTENRFRVVAETAGGLRKRAEVWGETATGARRNSRWELHSDEGHGAGGEDSAPSPLAYFSAAIAF